MATTKQREDYRLKWSNALRTKALLKGGRGRFSKEYSEHLENLAIDLLAYRERVRELINELQEDTND